MSLLRGQGRERAFLRFLFAVAWLIASWFLAGVAAHGFTHAAAFFLIRNVFEIFLLIMGFSYMEMAWTDERAPLRGMGLVVRPGAAREFALGGSLGWGMVTAVFLAIVLIGHFYIRIRNSPADWGLLVLQVFAVATASLAAEIAFRGYPFQQLIKAIGPLGATLMAGIVFALLKLYTPGATPTAMWVSGVAALLFSVAYLRTHALWLSWGLHFFCVATIGILFGQPLAGSRHSSSVIQTYADGSAWLTGGEYGPEGSVISLIALWVGLFILFRITRDISRNVRLEPVATTFDAGCAAPFVSSAPRHATEIPFDRSATQADDSPAR